MARADIDLDIFDDDDILEELKDRLTASWRKKEALALKQKIQALLKVPISVKEFDVDELNLADRMKFDYFIENFDRITEYDLRKIINK